MNIQDMNEGADRLQELFRQYRDACPAPEPGADFLPGIWRRIELRQSFWFSFDHLSRLFAAIAIAACLVLGLLNFTPLRSPGQQQSVVSSYADALAADQTAERTYYGEGIRGFTASASQQQ